MLYSRYLVGVVLLGYLDGEGHRVTARVSGAKGLLWPIALQATAP